MSDTITIAGVNYSRQSQSTVKVANTVETGSTTPPPARLPKNHPSHVRMLASLPKEVRVGTMQRLFGGDGAYGRGPATGRYRIPITPQIVSSNGVGQVQVVYGLQYTSLVGISDWASVFKEYRFVKAMVDFIPCGIPVLSASDASFGAGINYSGNITAPGSLAEVLSLDQGKVVGLGVCKPTTWEVNFSKIFGEVWTDTGTNVAFATWKAFNTATGNPTSIQLGNWTGWIEVEFRGFA